MTNYTWRRDGKDRVIFDGPNACHNLYIFAGCPDGQLDEMAKMLERAYFAGGEASKAKVRAAMAASR